MKTISVLAALIALVATADLDPTTFCFPKQVKWSETNLQREEVYTVKVDFASQKAEYTGNYATRRTVKDFATLMEYVIDDSGNCRSHSITLEETIPECLTAGAKYLGNLTIGVSPGEMNAMSWDFPWGNLNITMAFTMQPNLPSFPIIGKFHTGDPSMDFDIFFSNHATNFSLVGAFDIPDPCPPMTPV